MIVKSTTSKRSSTSRGRHERVVSVGASMGAFVALRHAGLGRPRSMRWSRSAVLRTRAHRSSRELGCSEPSPAPSGAGGCWTATAPAWTRAREPLTASPLDLVGGIAPIPVAIVDGLRDRYVPLREAYALFERLGEPRRLVVLRRFGHGEAAFTDEFAVRLERLVAELLELGPPSS